MYWCRKCGVCWFTKLVIYKHNVGCRIRNHDDVIKRKHFPRYWPFLWGIHRWPVNSPHKDQWRGTLMFSLICTRINGWVNNREAGDLRRHRAHFDVIAMMDRNLKGQINIFEFAVTLRMGDTCLYQWTGSSLVQVMAWGMVGAYLLSEPIPTYSQLDL